MTVHGRHLMLNTQNGWHLPMRKNVTDNEVLMDFQNETDADFHSLPNVKEYISSMKRRRHDKIRGTV